MITDSFEGRIDIPEKVVDILNEYKELRHFVWECERDKTFTTVANKTFVQIEKKYLTNIEDLYPMTKWLQSSYFNYELNDEDTKKVIDYIRMVDGEVH